MERDAARTIMGTRTELRQSGSLVVRKLHMCSEEVNLGVIGSSTYFLIYANLRNGSFV